MCVRVSVSVRVCVCVCRSVPVICDHRAISLLRCSARRGFRNTHTGVRSECS